MYIKYIMKMHLENKASAKVDYIYLLTNSTSKLRLCLSMKVKLHISCKCVNVQTLQQ